VRSISKLRSVADMGLYWARSCESARPRSAKTGSPIASERLMVAASRIALWASVLDARCRLIDLIEAVLLPGVIAG
jgi:hypothetical protein